MNEVFLITGMALVTFGARYALWGAAGRVAFPRWLSEALEFVPPAVLTAIIVPAVVVSHQQTLNLSFTNPALLAIIPTFLFSLWKQNLLFTIGLGMVIYFILKWGLGLH